MTRLRTGFLYAAIGLATLASAGTAHAYGISCDFTDTLGYQRLARQARATFAEWTKRDGSGRLVGCSAPYEAGCAQWQQDGLYSIQGVYGVLRVESVDYQHFHLGFEDPTITCPSARPNPDDGDGMGFGRGTFQACQPADWTHENRVLSPHDGYKTISVWVEGLRRQASFSGGFWVSTGHRLFDLKYFHNKGTVPVTLRVKWYDGVWYDLPNLGPGVHYVGDWAYSITEARFLRTVPGQEPFLLDNIVTDNIRLE